MKPEIKTIPPLDLLLPLSEVKEKSVRHLTMALNTILTHYQWVQEETLQIQPFHIPKTHTLANLCWFQQD